MHPVPSYQVLFLSVRNSARSILAEHILRAKAAGRFIVRSAGLQPSGPVDPMALEILRDRYEINAAGVRGKSWEEFRLIEFDFVITLSEEARENRICWRGNPVHAHWGSPHPDQLACSAEGRRQAFIDVASQIAARANLFCSFRDEQLVHGAWNAGTRFPFRNDYAPVDEERLEWTATR